MNLGKKRERPAFGALALLLGVLAITGQYCLAADWKPERNVEIIVGTGPGGGHDKTARLLQRIMQERRLIGVAATVVNKPGGGGEAITALLGGHVDLIASAANNVVGHVAAGKIRVIGITAPQRLGGAFAVVPTWREQGVDTVVNNWRMVAGPKGMAQPQIDYWESVLAKLVDTEEWKKDLEQNVFENIFMKSPEASRYLKSQYDEFRTVLVEVGMVK